MRALKELAQSCSLFTVNGILWTTTEASSPVLPLCGHFATTLSGCGKGQASSGVLRNGAASGAECRRWPCWGLYRLCHFRVLLWCATTEAIINDCRRNTDVSSNREQREKNHRYEACIFNSNRRSYLLCYLVLLE